MVRSLALSCCYLRCVHHVLLVRSVGLHAHCRVFEGAVLGVLGKEVGDIIVGEELVVWHLCDSSRNYQVDEFEFSRSNKDRSGQSTMMRLSGRRLEVIDKQEQSSLLI